MKSILILLVLIPNISSMYSQVKPILPNDNSCGLSAGELSIPLSLSLNYSDHLNSISSDTTIDQANSPDEDTLSPFTKPILKPEKISFMEKFLWGENGEVRKIGLAAPLSTEERKYELQVRRTMLTAHQIGGFATLGLMLSACYFGQKIIDGRRDLSNTYNTIVAATIASYALTGLLSVLSPPPMIRRDEESTISIHKTLAWAHFAGMILTPVLGQLIGGRRNFHEDRAHVHQISAYATTAIFTASMIVITF